MYRVSFGWEVGEVGCSGSPLECEMSHFYAILNPVIAHVDRFTALDLCCTIGDAASWRVVVGDNSWLLGMTEVGEGLTVNRGVLTVYKEGRVRGFGRGANNGRDDRGRSSDRTVDRI